MEFLTRLFFAWRRAQVVSEIVVQLILAAMLGPAEVDIGQMYEQKMLARRPTR